MEFSYSSIENLYDILNIIAGNSKIDNKLIMRIENKSVTFIISNKKFKLNTEISYGGELGREITLEINYRQFNKIIKQFKGTKDSCATIVNIDIKKDKLIIYGNKHSEEIDIEVMGYKVTEKLHFELSYNEIEISDLSIPCRIHGSDEWDMLEIIDILRLGGTDKSNLYISGTEHKAFRVGDKYTVETSIDKYIGQNTIIAGDIIKKLSRILYKVGCDKYYINSSKDVIDIQNWAKTFKLQIKHTKPVREKLIVYDNYSGIDYDMININLIRHRVMDSIRQVVLANGIENIDINIENIGGDEYRLSIGDKSIDIYSIDISSEIDDSEVKVYVDINNIYNMIEQCDSDFIALDMAYIGDKPSDGVAIRVSEIDLDKYEEAYEEKFSNISQFELRDYLNNEERLEIRNKCLNKKCYTAS